MFCSPRNLKSWALCLALGPALAALLVPAAADAAPVKLRYDFTAVITSTFYNHWCYESFGEGDDCASYEAAGHATTYEGPAVSTRGPSWLTVEFDSLAWDQEDALMDHSILGVRGFSRTWVNAYDPATRGIDLLYVWDHSDIFRFTALPVTGSGYGGSGYADWEQDDSGVDTARADFRIFDVRVSDLSAPQPGLATDLAPVPLPAALPLLAAGLAGLGWLGRRRQTRAA